MCRFILLTSYFPSFSCSLRAVLYICVLLLVCALTYVRACRKLDIWSGNWTRIAPMCYAVHHHSIGTDGRLVYVFGGRNLSRNIPQSPVGHVQIYNPGTNVSKWQIATYLPERTRHMCMQQCACKKAQTLDSLYVLTFFGFGATAVGFLSWLQHMHITDYMHILISNTPVKMHAWFGACVMI